VAVPIKPEALKWDKVAGVRIAPKEFVAYDYDEITKEGTGASWK
jgi:CRISPR-associated endonuclease/helicase Cas3